MCETRIITLEKRLIGVISSSQFECGFGLRSHRERERRQLFVTCSLQQNSVKLQNEIIKRSFIRLQKTVSEALKAEKGIKGILKTRVRQFTNGTKLSTVTAH